MGSIAKKARWHAIGLALLGTVCLANAEASSPPSHSDQDAHLSLVKRIEIATDIRAAVGRYFAHWQAIPNEDFNADYHRYLAQITRSDDRRSFDMATMALLAQLQNGHTGFGDAWLSQHSGPPPGLSVARRGDQWVVIRSQRQHVSPGDVITAIDDTPIQQFYADKKRYIAASNERQRSRKFFALSYLFPQRFTLHFEDGHSARIDRSSAPDAPDQSRKPVDINWPDGVYYHAIASFDDPKYEKAAVAFIKQHKDAKTLILDVRGNGGGTTPQQLINALITHSYLGMSQASAMSIGLLRAYGSQADSPWIANAGPEMKGFAQGMQDYFTRPMMYWPGALQKPDHPIYRHRLIMLADIGCASSCEDLLMPLKVSQRATIIGDTTYGSTGQPYIKQYDNGMGFRIGAKREAFGDGRPFEGVGIKPDIKIVPTAADLQKHRDPVIDKVKALLAKPDTSHKPS